MTDLIARRKGNEEVKGLFFIYLVIICLLANQGLFGQEQIVSENSGAEQLPTMVILKVKQEKLAQWQQIVKSQSFENYFGPGLGNIRINQAFPNHKPLPESDKSKNANLVDLSLIYKLKFQKNFPLDALIFRFNRLGIFEYVQPVFPVDPLFIPNDEKIGNQYYLSKIHAYQAWDISQGDTNTVIGIVDSGTDLDHPDLIGNLKYNYNDPIDGIDNDNDGFIDNYRGWDMGDMDNDPQVIAGGGNSAHGVHMCGIAAASTNNVSGVAGVGFRCKFLPVKMNDLNDQYIAGYEGMVYAADHGCKVINCSWGGQQNAGKYGQDIVNYVTFNRDALVVAASGNSNSDIPFWPASYDNVLSVGATGPDDERMFISNSYATSYGYYLDVCAPGSGIFNTWDYPYFYKSISGTSMAAAVTSGAAALVRSHLPALTALQTAEKLRATADKIDILPSNLPYFEKLGTGRINVFKALTDTVSPSIRVRQPHFTDGNDSVFCIGDTVQFRGEFYNFLADAHNVKITVHCLNSNVYPIDTLYTTSAIPSQTSVINQNHPFRFKLLSGLSSGEVIMFRLRYECDSFHSFEYVRLDLNSDYLNIKAQHIETTLTSKGKIGFNDDWNKQGIGFYYKSEINHLFSGGFILGTSYINVSDVLYNSTFSGWDSDFVPVEPIHRVLPSTVADQEFITRYNDDAAGTNALGVLVTQRTLSWDQPENSRFIVHELTIRNKGTISLANLYAGLFIDWDMNGQAPGYDRVDWDNDNRMGITHSLTGGPYAGISLVSEGPVKHYAFDNDGANGSICITNGFTAQEKYTALKSTRSQAGMGIYGNNVSDQVSTGPYLLLPGDSVVIAFGMMAAEQLTDLHQAAQMAKDRYYHVEGINKISGRLQNEMDIFPNPAMEKTSIRFFSDKPGKASITITDPSGRILTQISGYQLIYGWNKLDLNTDNLCRGVYFVNINLSLKTLKGIIVKI